RLAAARAIERSGYRGFPGDGRKTGLRLLVAKRAGERGLVQPAGIETHRLDGGVLAGQVGVEHHRVVGRDRAADAGGDELRERVLLERPDGARAEVRERAHVEDRAALGELAHQAWVLDRADAVPDPVGGERVEGAADGGCAGSLTGMGYGGEPEGACKRERVCVGLGRILRLEPAETHGDDTPIAVLRRVADDLLRLLGPRAAADVQ